MILLTYARASERAKRASAPETHIFMPQKCDISVWPIANPSAIIIKLFTSYWLYKVHFI